MTCVFVMVCVAERLKALPVHDGWAALVVLLLGDPHLLEGGEGREDGAADPHGVLALWRGDDLHLHRGWGEGGDFLLHAVRDTWVHGGATRLLDVSKVKKMNLRDIFLP